MQYKILGFPKYGGFPNHKLFWEGVGLGQRSSITQIKGFSLLEPEL